MMKSVYMDISVLLGLVWMTVCDEECVSGY